MKNIEVIDSLAFDLTQSVEDLGNEIELILDKFEKLNQKIEMLEKNQ